MNQVDYDVIVQGFMRKMRTLTQYFAHDWQVTDDETNVNRGGVYWVITRPGALPINPWPGVQNSKTVYSVDWNIVFDAQVKYASYKESWPKFAEMRDAIINLYVLRLDKSLPDANGNPIKGIWDISITAPDPPGQKPPAGTPTWVGQQLIAVITQRIDLR